MSGDNRQICINLPAEVVEALDQRGRTEDRSRSRLVLRYVRQGLQGEVAKNPEAAPLGDEAANAPE